MTCKNGFYANRSSAKRTVFLTTLHGEQCSLFRKKAKAYMLHISTSHFIGPSGHASAVHVQLLELEALGDSIVIYPVFVRLKNTLTFKCFSIDINMHGYVISKEQSCFGRSRRCWSEIFASLQFIRRTATCSSGLSIHFTNRCANYACR